MTPTNASSGLHPLSQRFRGAARVLVAGLVVFAVLPAVPAAAAPPKISITDVTLSEGDAGTGLATFTVSLSAAPGARAPKVNYATADGTAVAPTDYLSTTGTLTFSGGAITKSVSVIVNGDGQVEANEGFTVNLSGARNATIADGQGAGTISNDDAYPTISIGDVSIAEGNTGTKALTFPLSLSRPAPEDVTVDFATANGTATAPADYQASSGTVTFPAATASQTVQVQVVGDTLVESNQTFTVDLSNAVKATVADGQGVGTIVDDDTFPDLSVSDVTVAEGNSGIAPASFTVSLSAPYGVAVTVDYATANGTATEPGDYTAGAATLTILPGDTSGTIDVPVAGDTQYEPDETFTVGLSNPVNAVIVDPQGEGTVANDDKAPSSVSLRVAKKKGISASGWLTPAHPGDTVTVTLYRKKGSSWVKVLAKRPTLHDPKDPDGDGTFSSRYSTAFKRPRKGGYKVTVSFAGDADHAACTTSKTFSL